MNALAFEWIHCEFKQRHKESTLDDDDDDDNNNNNERSPQQEPCEVECNAHSQYRSALVAGRVERFCAAEKDCLSSRVRVLFAVQHKSIRLSWASPLFDENAARSECPYTLPGIRHEASPLYSCI
jgi:hypothetical protein